MSKKKLALTVIGVMCIMAVTVVVTIAVQNRLAVPGESEAPSELVTPADVLSVWESPPSPQGIPPILLGEIALAEYGKENSGFKIEPFFLSNCQWIDVIVKSKNTYITFLEREPGFASFWVDFEYSNAFYCPDREDLEARDVGGVNPFLGRILHQQQTKTDTGMLYTIAVRLFEEGEYKDGNWLGSQCTLAFQNFNLNKSGSVSYEVYELDVTPGWGSRSEESYYRTVLIPWIHQHTSSESEAEQMLRDWLQQFKLS